MQRLPGFPVDFGLESRPEGFVGVVGAEEVSVANEEALLVVVGVNEPASDTVGAVVRTSPVLGSKTSTSFTFTLSCVRPKYSCGFPMVETEQPAKPFTGAHLLLAVDPASHNEQ